MVVIAVERDLNEVTVYLLVAARELWRTLPEADDDADARVIARTAARLIHLADILAVTSGA